MNRAVLLAIALAVTTAAGPGEATTLVHLDTASLTRNADQIVVGTVDGVRSYWNAPHTRILTDVGVSVSETIKGSVVSHLVVTQLGGEVDGVKVSVAGCPVFRVGEEALLFVAHNRTGLAQLTGLGQGKFEIVRAPVTGERLVQRQTPGLSVTELRGLKPQTSQRSTTPSLKLDDFVREIRGAMTTEGGR